MVPSPAPAATVCSVTFGSQRRNSQLRGFLTLWNLQAVGGEVSRKWLTLHKLITRRTMENHGESMPVFPICLHQILSLTALQHHEIPHSALMWSPTSKASKEMWSPTSPSHSSPSPLGPGITVVAQLWLKSVSKRITYDRRATFMLYIYI